MYPTLEAPQYGISLQAYGVAFLVALLLAWWLIPRSAEAIAGIDRRRARTALLVIMLATLIGGRLHFILNAPIVFAGRWGEAFKPWFGGYHVGGGFVAGLLALILTARWMQIPFGRLADGMLPPAGICVAVGRVGCFLAGCCIGAPCDKPWCLTYPEHSTVFEVQSALHMVPADAHESLALHPLQLYFAGAALLVSAAMYAIARRRRYDGEVALYGFFLFWASTAALEGLRAPWAATPLWGPLRQLQWVAVSLTAVFFVALVYAEWVHRSKAPSSPAPSARPTAG